MIKKKNIILGLVMVINILLPALESSITYAEEFTEQNYEEISYEYNGDNNINNSVVVTENSIIINGKEYTNEKGLEEILITAEPINNENMPASRSVAIAPGIAVGSYFIPGVGQVLVLATGAVVIAGVTIHVGHWAYKKIKSWFSNYRRNIANYYGIPERLLDNRGNVRLGDFKNKVKGKQAWKDPKTGYTKEKDTAGHGGKKWKIKDKQGKRKASTDGNGKILSK